MTNDINSLTTPVEKTVKYWRGLGVWNIYFILKFALLWYGYLNFHPLENLVFMAFLLFPLPSDKLHKLRNWLAIPIGFALFWYDTWLPGLDSIMSQGSQLAGFSSDYLIELINRFINWQMVGAGFILIVAYLFLSQWIRISVFTVVALVWLNVITIAAPMVSLLPQSGSAGSQSVATDGTPNSVDAAGKLTEDLPPTTTNLSAYLAKFYENQKNAMTHFPTSLPQDAEPFDILVINICSMSWSDIQSVQLDNHPLWQRLDIMFDNFNSATSYSGPASIRLLRASCGQTSHKDLYSPMQQQCYLFDNLAQLGFASELMMDHTGIYGNYLDELRQYGGMSAPLQSQQGISNELTSFDGSAVYNDFQTLTRWLETREKEGGNRSATFFNTIELHDGNRFSGQSKAAPYQARAKILLDDLNRFVDSLEKSGRKVMVIIVPEHGAALVGDKMQISGLRDIPSPSITHVPAGIKFINAKGNKPDSQIRVKGQSSYLAVSEIVSRVVDGKIFTQDTINWQSLVQNLPETAVVSENDNAKVMKYQDKYYVSLSGGSWVPYPAN